MVCEMRSAHAGSRVGGGGLIAVDGEVALGIRGDDEVRERRTGGPAHHGALSIEDAAVAGAADAAGGDRPLHPNVAARVRADERQSVDTPSVAAHRDAPPTDRAQRSRGEGPDPAPG